MKNDRLSESDLELLRQVPDDQLSSERLRAHLLAQGMRPERRRRVAPLVWMAAGGWVAAGLVALSIFIRVPQSAMTVPQPEPRPAPTAETPTVTPSAAPERTSTPSVAPAAPTGQVAAVAPSPATPPLPAVPANERKPERVASVTPRRYRTAPAPTAPSGSVDRREDRRPVMNKRAIENLVAMSDRNEGLDLKSSSLRIELRPEGGEIDKLTSEVRKSLAAPPAPVLMSAPTAFAAQHPRAERETVIMLSETSDPKTPAVAVEKEVTSGFAVGG